MTATPASANITVIDPTRKSFLSTVNQLGQPLMGGYDYMGRLQYVDDNLRLCPDKHDPYRKYDIVVPKDGLPVALFAKAGGCTIYEKLMVASTLIHHGNAVGFLIIQDDMSSSSITLDANANANGNPQHQDTHAIETRTRDPEIDYFEGDEDGEFNPSSLDSFGPELELADAIENGRRLIQRDHEPEESTARRSLYGYGRASDLAVLEVSYQTGNDILDIPFFPYHREGGPRVLLNGKGNAVGPMAVILWMLVTFSCCACICACLLLCIHSSFEEEPEVAPPRRPTRRRLTIEEVRERFPSYRFQPARDVQLGGCCPSGDADKFSLTGGATPVVHHDYTQLSDLDECTICLDEFMPGVKVRKLPCGHIFHSTCIAKWLIERSAVCPLCKLDLYVEPEPEDEDDDDDDESDTDAAARSLASRLTRFFTIGGDGGGTEYTPLALATGSAEGETEGVPGDDPNNDDPEEAAGDGNESAEQQRPWWPFSMEIVAPGSEDEDEYEDETTTDQRPRRSGTSPLSEAAVGAVAWTWSRVVGSVRRQGRRRRHRRGTIGGAVQGTELTEPLVPVPSASNEAAGMPPVASGDSGNSSSNNNNNNAVDGGGGDNTINDSNSNSNDSATSPSGAEI
eukprot:CAMPEP_0197174900 /NCGR_PEP_ID=MMETSP1423-20130617/1263_1 /TAXON_ID=476441 /ORGANISM="Pseudo-nitzschia heimii, Strain UNC1101" /LENGTH=624 /DNA_ID=CAMNT_0042623913 /DNA_START=377 /DNA_END=2251 /DNA_ORIENTATION=+